MSNQFIVVPVLHQIYDKEDRRRIYFTNRQCFNLRYVKSIVNRNMADYDSDNYYTLIKIKGKRNLVPVIACGKNVVKAIENMGKARVVRIEKEHGIIEAMQKWSDAEREKRLKKYESETK